MSVKPEYDTWARRPPSEIGLPNLHNRRIGLFLIFWSRHPAPLRLCGLAALREMRARAAFTRPGPTIRNAESFHKECVELFAAAFMFCACPPELLQYTISKAL